MSEMQTGPSNGALKGRFELAIGWFPSETKEIDPCMLCKPLYIADKMHHIGAVMRVGRRHDDKGQFSLYTAHTHFVRGLSGLAMEHSSQVTLLRT